MDFKDNPIVRVALGYDGNETWTIFTMLYGTYMEAVERVTRIMKGLFLSYTSEAATQAPKLREAVENKINLVQDILLGPFSGKNNTEHHYVGLVDEMHAPFYETLPYVILKKTNINPSTVEVDDMSTDLDLEEYIVRHFYSVMIINTLEHIRKQLGVRIENSQFYGALETFYLRYRDLPNDIENVTSHQLSTIDTLFSDLTKIEETCKDLLGTSRVFLGLVWISKAPFEQQFPQFRMIYLETDDPKNHCEYFTKKEVSDAAASQLSDYVDIYPIQYVAMHE